LVRYRSRFHKQANTSWPLLRYFDVIGQSDQPNERQEECSFYRRQRVTRVPVRNELNPGLVAENDVRQWIEARNI